MAAENIENCNSCDTEEKIAELPVLVLAKFSEDLLDMAKENWCESHIIMLRRLILAVQQGTRYDETLLQEEEKRVITPEDLVKMIKQREKEISCENCMFCNLGPYHDGLWYCRNRSILKIPEDISGCFRRSRRK